MDIKDKVDLESLNIKEDKIKKLREVFPEIVSEGKVDFEKLRLTLGDDVEIGKERYGMNWPGKANCFKIIQTPSKATLKPAKEESVDFDTTENLFIEGDSLEVLKLLQSSYYGKVKMIYIDPPYNTGKDFVYPDNYSESLETYLRYTGQKGKDGLKLSTNTETEGRYHSKWINMMYVRIFLAKNLLKDDGVIFISIDDHEADNLKKICNEILGEENFIAQIIWQSKSGGSHDEKNIVQETEYIFVYAKDENKAKFGRKLIENNNYTLEDSHVKERGKYLLNKLDRSMRGEHYSEALNYFIKAPDDVEIWPGGLENKKSDWNWRWSKNKVEWGFKNDFLVVKKNNEGKWAVYSKQYELMDHEGNEIQRDYPYRNLILSSEFNTTQGGFEILKILEGNIFDYAKPTKLMVYLLKLAAPKENEVILDFFAGSATMAHGVLELNKEDCKNLKFIVVQIPEPTDEDSEANRAGYKNIAEIGKERIRRVIKKIKEEKDGKLDLDGIKQDLGFRVFKLDESNFKVWEGEKLEDLAKQLELYKNNVRDDSKPENILYELILKSGFEISCKVEELEIQCKKVYSVEDGQLMICLEKGLTKELMKEIAEKEPARVICLDEGFEGNDQLLTNTVEVLKTKGVEFRTV